MATAQEIQAAMDRLQAGFDRRWENNPDFRAKLKGKDRDILIDLGADGQFHLVVRDGHLEEIKPERPIKANATVNVAADDLLAIFDGKLHPIKAFTSGRVKVRAGIRDILLVKAFFGG